MIKNKLYNVLIYVIIILKVIYLLLTLLNHIAGYSDWDTKTKDFINTMTDNCLIVSDFFMYMVLIILFSPLRKKPVDIVINKHEQLIIWTLGILGLIHTNWNSFESFFKELSLIIHKI